MGRIWEWVSFFLVFFLGGEGEGMGEGGEKGDGMGIGIEANCGQGCA